MNNITLRRRPSNRGPSLNFSEDQIVEIQRQKVRLLHRVNDCGGWFVDPPVRDGAETRIRYWNEDEMKRGRRRGR